MSHKLKTFSINAIIICKTGELTVLLSFCRKSGKVERQTHLTKNEINIF